MSKLDTIYGKLPLWGQNAAVTMFGIYWRWLRFAGNYNKYVRDYTDREKLDEQQLSQYIAKELSKLLSISSEKVPYYKMTWGKSEKAAAAAGVLNDLPLLEKEPIRKDPISFLRSDMKSSKAWIFHTSGSTGTPIASYWTADEVRNSLALREARSLGWAGVSFRMPRATISGRMVEPIPVISKNVYRFNHAERQVYFSAFHIMASSTPHYLEASS